MGSICTLGRAPRCAAVLSCAETVPTPSTPRARSAGGGRARAVMVASAGLLVLGLVAAIPAGCTGNPTSAPAGTAAPEYTEPRTGVVDRGVPEPREGEWIRLAGDPSLVVERRGDFYFFGTASITTELPDGYPPPTPPGAMDLKRYPSVRRAEVRGRSNPDLGTNIGFFPLFNHIQRRRIAMTSPVEVDYRMTGDEASPREVEWTMSFLYRSADLGPTGVDERDRRVRIVDTEPVTVVSVGLQGPYRLSRMMEAVKDIEAWLQQNPHWEVAGEPRALYYNGPEQPERTKWAEAQVPVRRRPADATPR
jgi:hypothetical protein